MLQVIAFARTVQGAIILVLTAALVALSLYVWGFNIGPIGFDGIADKLGDCRERAKLIQAESKARQDRVRTVVKEGAERIKYVDRRVKELVDRPVPGNCKTPDLPEWKELL